MIPSQALSDTRSSRGATHQMHPAPSSTSTLQHLPTTTCPWSESASRRCPSGRQAAASTSRTLTVAATKGSRSHAGTTRTGLREGTSHFPMSVVTSGAQRCPKRPASPTMHTVSGTTLRSRCPARRTRLQALCPVSITHALFMAVPRTRYSRFVTSGRAVCNL